MKMTMDDANNIMDSLMDDEKTLTIDQQVDGSIVLDMGKFLVAYANASYAYIDSRKDYKKQNQKALNAMKTKYQLLFLQEALNAMSTEYQRMKGEVQ
jgi:hypothetical protein